MSVTRAIANNTMIQISGRAIGTFLGLLTVGIMTRHLGQTGYGEFTTVMSFLQFFGIIADFGLTMTMVRMIADVTKDERKVASNIFTLRVISGLIFFGIAPIVALGFPYPIIVKMGIAVASVSHFGNSLSQVLVGIFQKHLSVHRSAVAEVIGRSVLLIGVLVSAYLGFGLLSFIIALLVANLLQFALTFALAQRHVAVRLDFDLSLWRDIIRISWPIGLSILFNLVYLKGDIIVLSVTRSAAEVGLYGAAYKVLDVVTAIPMIFMGLVLPLLTVAWSSSDTDDFRRKLGKAFDFLSLIALPITFGAFPVADDLMRLIAGDAFATSGAFLSILMIAGAAVFWSALFGHAVVALNLQKKMIWAYAIVAAIALTLYIALIPEYGAISAAWITVLSEVMIAIITAIAVFRMTGYVVSMKTFGRALLAAALMTSAVYGMSDIHVLLRIAFGAIVYAVSLYFLGGVPKEMLSLLRRDKGPRT